MTLPEHVGKVATSAIDALRHSPGLLSVILLQVVTLVMLGWIASTNAEHRQERELWLMERCFPVPDTHDQR